MLRIKGLMPLYQGKQEKLKKFNLSFFERKNYVLKSGQKVISDNNRYSGAHLIFTLAS